MCPKFYVLKILIRHLPGVHTRLLACEIVLLSSQMKDPKIFRAIHSSGHF